MVNSLPSARFNFAILLGEYQYRKHLSFTALKWKAKPDERLHLINEAAVRAFFAEQFGVEMPGKFSELIGTEEFPDETALKTRPYSPKCSDRDSLGLIIMNYMLELRMWFQ